MGVVHPVERSSIPKEPGFVSNASQNFLIKQSLETSETFIFEIPEIILGRDPTCTLNVDDQTISARHAKLSYHQSQWWVKDLGSTNGTFLNQERIEEQQVITSGDILQFGKIEYEIRIQVARQEE